MTNAHDDGVPSIGEVVLFHATTGPDRVAIVMDRNMTLQGATVDVAIITPGPQGPVRLLTGVEWGRPENPETTPWCGDLRRERVRPLHPRRETIK